MTDINFVDGTGDDDHLTGTEGVDFFGIEQGGADTVDALGGNDAIFTNAAFSADDRIDGGEGYDDLYISGNYWTPLILEDDTIHDIEAILFSGGFDASLVMADGNIAAGQRLSVFAELLPTDHLNFDGSAETDGGFYFRAGEGVMTLTGGAGDDVLQTTAPISNDDHFDAGAGNDTLDLFGDIQSSYSFGDGQLLGFDWIGCWDATTNLTLTDSAVEAGHTMRIDIDVSRHALIFDGSDEKDGAFLINTSQGGDVAVTGAGDDVFQTRGGDDILTGGQGADQFTGGGGVDTFIYLSLEDSTVAAPDHILDLAKKDVVDLSGIDADITLDGDQAFHIVKKFDGHAGELTIKYDASVGMTNVMLDIDGDGSADATILFKNNHHTYDHFVL